MYEEHPNFIQPENESSKVWRYMDLSKFVALISSSELYFTRPDKFEDPFEGSWPVQNATSIRTPPDTIPKEDIPSYREGVEQLVRMRREWPKYNAVNCWHMNDFESAAMWKIYLKSDEGVAIQSTYARLKESFDGDQRIFLGKVSYLDYETDIIPDNNLYAPLVHKRKSFQHENEVRAVISQTPRTNSKGELVGRIDHGLNQRVQLETLIEAIHIAPSAPTWFANIINSIVTTYGFNFPVKQSKLNETPLY